MDNDRARRARGLAAAAGIGITMVFGPSCAQAWADSSSPDDSAPGKSAAGSSQQSGPASTPSSNPASTSASKDTATSSTKTTDAAKGADDADDTAPATTTGSDGSGAVRADDDGDKGTDVDSPTTAPAAEPTAPSEASPPTQPTVGPAPESTRGHATSSSDPIERPAGAAVDSSTEPVHQSAPAGSASADPPAVVAASRKTAEPIALPPHLARSVELTSTADEAAAAPSVLPTAEAVALKPADPQDLQRLYTGTPNILTQLIAFGLQIVGAILRPIGGVVALTGLPIKIPFINDGAPPFFLTGGLNVTSSQYQGMTVWTLQPLQPTGKYVVALHGGAYAAEASIFHYATYTDLARNTGATVVVPDYPLILEGGTAQKVVPPTADLIAQLVAQHGAENVSVLGDSAGGGLAVAAVRTLADRPGNVVPGRLVLLAPWLDVTMSDPLSAAINDPLLTVGALRQDGALWAGDLDPSNPIVSPLFGSLAGLPPTTVFSGSLDLLAADTLRLRDRTIAEGYTNFTFVLRNGLIHDFPIFGFLPEAYSIRPEIYAALLDDYVVPASVST